MVGQALDEYMPYLNGVVASLATDDLLLSQEPGPSPSLLALLLINQRTF